MDGEPRLRAFDVTVPAAPVLLNGSAYDPYDTDSRDVVVVDTTALLVGMGYDGGGWGAVFDVSDPTNPVFEDRLDVAGVPTDVEVVGRRAYVGLVMPDGRGEIAVVAF